MTNKIIKHLFWEMVMKKIIIISFLLLLVLVTVDAASNGDDSSRTISADELISRYKLTRIYDLQDGSQTLKNSHISLTLVPGMCRILVNGKIRKTEYPNRYSNDHLLVDRSVLGAIAHMFPPDPRKINVSRKLIVIDPGHGGKDSGATAGGICEKDIVLSVSRELNKKLSKSGFRVQMTRNSDTYLSLESRADKANRAGADLFISIHANSTSRAIAEGIETFYLVNRSAAFDRKRLVRASTKYTISDISKNPAADSENAIKRAVLAVLLQDTRLSSKMLAEEVQKSMILCLREVNRGIKPANWSVLRNSVFPAILVEIGFINNPVTAAKFRKSSYRAKVADSIAVGVRKYFSRKAQLGYEY